MPNQTHQKAAESASSLTSAEPPRVSFGNVPLLLSGDDFSFIESRTGAPLLRCEPLDKDGWKFRLNWHASWYIETRLQTPAHQVAQWAKQLATSLEAVMTLLGFDHASHPFQFPSAAGAVTALLQLGPEDEFKSSVASSLLFGDELSGAATWADFVNASRENATSAVTSARQGLAALPFLASMARRLERETLQAKALLRVIERTSGMRHNSFGTLFIDCHAAYVMATGRRPGASKRRDRSRERLPESISGPCFRFYRALLHRLESKIPDPDRELSRRLLRDLRASDRAVLEHIKRAQRVLAARSRRSNSRPMGELGDGFNRGAAEAAARAYARSWSRAISESDAHTRRAESARERLAIS